MPNPRYVAGVAEERRVQAILDKVLAETYRQAGYSVDRMDSLNGDARTAGSHGPWDVIAVKRGRTREHESRIAIFVQCKTHKVR